MWKNIIVHRIETFTITVFGPPVASEPFKETTNVSMVLYLQNHRNVFVESVCKREERGRWGGLRMDSILTAIWTHNCHCAFFRVYPIEFICVSMSTVIALIVDINFVYVYVRH